MRKKKAPRPCLSPKGYWYCTIDKKQFSLHCNGQENEALAWERFDKLRRKIKGEIVSDPNDKDGNLEQVCWSYLAYLKKTYTEKHYLEAKRTLHKLIKVHGRTPLNRITATLITDWLKAQSTWGVSTQRFAGSIIKAAFNYCLEHKKIDQNPIPKLKLPKGKTRIRYLTEAQEKFWKRLGATALILLTSFGFA